jgi:hypothetical protein
MIKDSQLMRVDNKHVAGVLSPRPSVRYVSAMTEVNHASERKVK